MALRRPHGLQKASWPAKTCIAWLDPPEEQLPLLEKESVLELRTRVEAQCTQTKFQLRGDADQHDQEFWYTPPHFGKLFNPTELAWAADKQRYRCSRKEQRKTSEECLALMIASMKQSRDVSAYMSKPARYVRACLRRTRDLVHEVYARSEQSTPEYLLVPEVHAALAEYSRQVAANETPSVDLCGAVPDKQSLTWDSVRLNTSEKLPGQEVSISGLLGHVPKQKVALRKQQMESLFSQWEQFLLEEKEKADQLQKAKNEAAERAQLKAVEREAKRQKKEAAAAAAAQREATNRQQAIELQKQRDQEERWIQKRQEQERLQREKEQQNLFKDLVDRYERSRFKCTCKGHTLHSEKCQLRDAHTGILCWRGADLGLTFEESQRVQSRL